MKRVDFFEVTDHRPERSICQLLERLWSEGERLYVLCLSQAELELLDDKIWTFSKNSFIPHAIWRGDGVLEEPIALGSAPGNPNRAGCLVNLTDETVEESAGFNRVVEVVPSWSDEGKARARERFRSYRAGGIEPVYHRTG